MKIALIGYGKMGHMIEETARARGHEVVCVIDVDNQEDFGSDALRSADVAIEFTAPAVAWTNVQRCWEAGVKVVSGSTGWFAQHEEEVERACKDGAHTLFWSSNFSIGVAIFDAVNRYLAALMQCYADYTPTMTETHHIHKLDAPSGTALTLRQGLMEAAPRVEDVPIQSIREGEVPGIHTIEWNSEADKITITHDAHSRRGFALGAVIAAEYTLSHTGLIKKLEL